MKYLLLATLCLMSATTCFAEDTPLAYREDQVLASEQATWECIPDVAEYKLADWDNVVLRVNGITVEEAMDIANQLPEVGYFFVTKGHQMVLENEEVIPPLYRVFHEGDTVFFSGEPWWGSAPGLADGFIKAHD